MSHDYLPGKKLRDSILRTQEMITICAKLRGASFAGTGGNIHRNEGVTFIRNIQAAGVSKLKSEVTLKKLGERIKQLRIKKGYSSYEYFAYEHNISRAQFGRYENGQDLRISSLVKVMNAFGMTLQEFFSEGFD